MGDVLWVGWEGGWGRGGDEEVGEECVVVWGWELG